jgi:hypothetical protein
MEGLGSGKHKNWPIRARDMKELIQSCLHSIKWGTERTFSGSFYTEDGCRIFL